MLTVRTDSDFQFPLNSLDIPTSFREAYKNKLLNVPGHIHGKCKYLLDNSIISSS